MARKSILYPTGLRFFLIIVIVLGVFFRFVNLDRKVYWFDESMTTKRISASADYVDIFKGKIITIEDWHKYQHLHPVRSANDTIEACKWSPQVPPLYFQLLRLWVQWFGNSVAVTRSLSAFISLLVFPCLYWLCIELFQSSLVGWIAVALIAVSPFHILYAQEARMYSLHTVMILFSSASLLRAIRVKTKLSWGLYSVSLALGLYAHTIFVLVAIGHGIYVLATEGIQLSKVFVSYLIASLVGLLTFTPWLSVIVNHYARVRITSNWVNTNISLSKLVKDWFINFSRIFIDLNPDLSINIHLKQNYWLLIVIPFLLIIVLYSNYFTYHNNPKKIWLFIITLISTTALSLAVPDLIFGGVRSDNPRYLIASYLGIHLTVAYLLATKIVAIPTKFWQQRLWQSATIILISSGVISDAIITQSEVWWNKGNASELLAMARTLNQANYSLLVIDSHFWSRDNAWSLNTLLQPNVRLQLLEKSNISTFHDGFSDVFLFTPSEELQKNIAKERKFKIVPISKGDLSLWKLEKYAP